MYVVLAATCVRVVGNVVVRSCAQFQGPPSPHRRVNSGNSCQSPTTALMRKLMLNLKASKDQGRVTLVKQGTLWSLCEHDVKQRVQVFRDLQSVSSC